MSRISISGAMPASGRRIGPPAHFLVQRLEAARRAGLTKAATLEHLRATQPDLWRQVRAEAKAAHRAEMALRRAEKAARRERTDFKALAAGERKDAGTTP